MGTAEQAPDLASRLRQYRDDAGMTQQQLAEAAKLSLSIVAQIERGKSRDPRLSTLKALAEALGVKVKDLVGEG